jgi:hypothetical protein
MVTAWSDLCSGVFLLIKLPPATSKGTRDNHVTAHLHCHHHLPAATHNNGHSTHIQVMSPLQLHVGGCACHNTHSKSRILLYQGVAIRTDRHHKHSHASVASLMSCRSAHRKQAMIALAPLLLLILGLHSHRTPSAKAHRPPLLSIPTDLADLEQQKPWIVESFKPWWELTCLGPDVKPRPPR